MFSMLIEKYEFYIFRNVLWDNDCKSNLWSWEINNLLYC